MKRHFLNLFLLIACCCACVAQSDYKMAGPYEIVARDGRYAKTKGGSERDMWQAWQSAKAGDTATALTIINAYANTLQGFEGHDAPLCTIQAYWLVRAMIQVRDGNEGNKEEMDMPVWSAMVRRAILPVLERFEAYSPYANGNWGAIVNRCRMACAVFLKDTVLYQSSIDYFLHANDNGSLPKYVGETGQCQETGRDQGHAQLGLGALCETCELAWGQGDDLWGALDNRLMKGIEYTAKYNLGYEVPFETWTDCTGLYNDWTEPGEMGRGIIRCIYDLPYQHYVGRKGLKMPYTKKVLALQKRAEKHGELKYNPEANNFKVPGVKEGAKLHSIYTYPAPAGAPLKDDYDVFIQPRGKKEWTKIDTYMAKVNAPQLTPDLAPSKRGEVGGVTAHRVSEISYCMFDFTGDVFVRVVSKHRKFKSARIRPDYRGTIAQVQNDSTVQFLLFQPENVSVEFDGDITSNLLVFTSKPPVAKEDAEAQARKEGRKFIYFPPGYYSQADMDAKLSNSQAGVGSGTTVYLAGGAYCTGTFAIADAANVSILGRGIARPGRGYEGAHVYRSKNVLIDGLVLNTCPIGGSSHVKLHDVRSISHPQWGDGLNVFGGCSDILFDRVFCRNSDDCTTAYATRKGFSGSVRNVRMTNSTLWADVAHPIFIGLHGAAAGPHPELCDTVENLRYDNIDIICQAEQQVDYQGCLAINCGDNNLVRNVTFDNIRVEGILQGCLTHVKVGWNPKYCKAPGLGVEDIMFRTIRLYTSQTAGAQYPSVITGYDAERKVKNVTFEGLKINGRTISDDMPGKPKWHATSDYVPMFVGSHVENLKFTK